MSRASYIITLFASSIFYFAYKDNLSLIILILLIVFPAFLLILLVIARSGVKAELRLVRTVLEKGEAIRFEIKTVNKSIIPLTQIKYKIVYRNKFVDEESFVELIAPARARSSDVISGSFLSTYAGVILVELRWISLFDYINFFEIPIFTRQALEAVVLPEHRGLDIELASSIGAVDTEIFSQTKSGDDPSEVFGIRDYIGGDRQNRIHWKLTAKQDKLLVKEYSLPICNAVQVILEFSVKKNVANYLRTLESLIETISAYSLLLCEQGTPHDISHYDGSGFNERRILNEDDLTVFLSELLRSSPQQAGRMALKTSLSSFEGQGDINIVYITAVLTRDTLTEIEDSGLAAMFTVIELCSEIGNKAPFELVGNVRLHRVLIANHSER